MHVGSAGQQLICICRWPAREGARTTAAVDVAAFRQGEAARSRPLLPRRNGVTAVNSADQLMNHMDYDGPHDYRLLYRLRVDYS